MFEISEAEVVGLLGRRRRVIGYAGWILLRYRTISGPTWETRCDLQVNIVPRTGLDTVIIRKPSFGVTASGVSVRTPYADLVAKVGALGFNEEMR